MLAPFSLLASDLPAPFRWPLAALALAEGLRLLRRHRRTPRFVLCIPPGAAAASCNGRPVDHLRLRWRGPLAFLDWRQGGQRVRRVLWPDVLGPDGRRELELVMQQRQAASRATTMAG